MTQRRKWSPIVERAAEIVRGYDTDVTLRQLFYRLVSEEVLRNTPSDYKTLSARTAEARRTDGFPDLADTTRSIWALRAYEDMSMFVRSMVSRYHVDRTEGQPVSLYLGIEKNALRAQVQSWFTDLGVPFLPLGGYASQTFKNDVRDHVRWRWRDRPAVLIYAGDFDPSGEDIDRDFIERTDCWAEVHRIGLTWEQIVEYNLPPQLGKASDSRAAAFKARHGRLVQVELDALPSDTLRDLYQEAIDQYWDASAYEAALAREEEERDILSGWAETLDE